MTIEEAAAQAVEAIIQDLDERGAWEIIAEDQLYMTEKWRALIVEALRVTPSGRGSHL